jgi:c-di-GMP-binding flagellar brake protein YcgR
VDTLNSPEKTTKAHHGVVNIERRNYPRFNIDMPIEYYRIGETTGSRGRTLNMSERGLLIYTSERMEIGQRLRLRLFRNMGPELNTIELLSEVVWVEIHIGEDCGDYRSGIRFVDTSPDDMTKVKNFLKSFFQLNKLYDE